MLMGIIIKTSLQMCYSLDHLYSIPIFGISLPRNKFLLLLSNLHFSNNEETMGDIHLHKIQYTSDRLHEKFQKVTC